MRKQKILVTTLTFVFLLSVLLMALPLTTYAAEQDNSQLDRFIQVFQTIKSQYLKQVDDKTLIDAAIQGMTESLGDPYSVYMDAEQYKQFNADIEGSFSGIGVEIIGKDDQIIVVAPIEGSPADRAGIKSKDRIVEIDGHPVTGLTAAEVETMLRGEPGTKVCVTLTRDDLPAAFTVELTRETITLKSVASTMLSGDIGYLKLSQFEMKSPLEFQQALDELKAQGAQGLVLDLRDNPGGVVTSALYIASDFIPQEKPLLHVLGRDGSEETYNSIGPSGELWNKPVVVLVNGGSASASEILGGILQDYGVGKLVGTQTFGKGIMQGIQEFPDGSALKLTVKEYLTPNGRKVDGVGLTPNIQVEDENLQLERAIEILKPPAKKTIELGIGRNQAKVNGNDVKVEVAPVLEGNRTLIPLRFIAEALGAKVDWNGEERKVTLTLDGKSVTLTIGSTDAVVNGQPVTLEVPAEIKDDRTMVPLRFVTESLGAAVDWDPATQAITISK